MASYQGCMHVEQQLLLYPALSPYIPLYLALSRSISLYLAPPGTAPWHPPRRPLALAPVNGRG
jgi:hypothetical protein